MAFQPLKQINAVITQQYFEPTISWALRVMLALNIPLIVGPLLLGEFSYDLVWAAFGGYMISLTDYRGLHYKKIVIQGLESVLVVLAATLGMLVAPSVVLTIATMFFIGFFAAIIRNWSDYGGSIGVAVGFFYLFGLSYPAADQEILIRIGFLFTGCCWAMLITFISFPFRPVDPVKRSVAKIWKANTDLLDALNSEKTPDQSLFAQKEMAVRNEINHSVELFDRRAIKSGKARHYTILMELRRVSALFSASLSSIHEELEVLRTELTDLNDAPLNKTLSAFAQCSARIAIVTYTSRPEDYALARTRLVRCRTALEVLSDEIKKRRTGHPKEKSILHFLHAIDRAYVYMEQSVDLIERKINLNSQEYFEGYKLSFNNFVSGIQSWVIVDFVRSFLNVSSDQFRYALRVSILLCFGVFLFRFFKIDHGYWIPLTMMIVIQPYYGATRKKSWERVVGTVAGILVGGLLLLLPLSHYFFVVLLMLDSFFVAYYLRNNYKVGVFFVTVMMVVLMQLSQQGSWQLIGWRIISTFIGAVLALLAGYVLWPVWENERFPALFRKALDSQLSYLRTVLQFVNGITDETSWYVRRRNSEQNINQCFASVQRMLEEPGDKRNTYDLCFAMVGAGIRINREITSIALLSERDKTKTKIAALSDFIAEAERYFRIIEEQLQREVPAAMGLDFTALKNSLNTDHFTANDTTRLIRNELEKIIFEMETVQRQVNSLHKKSGSNVIPVT